MYMEYAIRGEVPLPDALERAEVPEPASMSIDWKLLCIIALKNFNDMIR
jgi:hypothetical protein